MGAPRTIAVSKDGTQVLFLRSQSCEDPVLCLWVLDTGTGTERLLADPSSLVSSADADLPAAELARRERARESANGIVSYSLDRAAHTAVFALGGALFRVGIADGLAVALEASDDVFDPRISPDGNHVSYISGQTLRLHCLTSGCLIHGASNDILLKDDEHPLVSWGRAEFIAGEEMSRTRGYWWSPDSDALLVTRVDESPLQRRWISDPAHPEREPNEVRYPAAGTANANVDLALVKLDGQTSEVDWQDGQFEYLANVKWDSSGPPLVLRQPRDQRSLSIAELDLQTLAVNEVRQIQDEHWVELVPGSPTRSKHGLLTVEDRSADLDNRVLCLNGKVISPSDFQVRSIIAIQGDEVLTTVSIDPTEIHLVVLSLVGGAPRHITDQPGVHHGVSGGETLVITSSLADQSQTSISVQRWDSGDNNDDERANVTSPPASIINLAEQPLLQAKPIYLRLGQSELSAALFLPQDHDGRASLPVVMDPYGGPHAQRVLKTQNSHLVSQWFANQGFAVLVVDGRGTPGRGPRFERAVWGDLAQPVLDDQIEALDAAANSYPFLDLDRVGIRGWSFGGYLAALAVLRRPDRFHAALAGAPVTSWRLYDTYYTERYLGHPDTYPENYERSDLLGEAAGLGSPLLIIHGLADDNVVAAHTLLLSSALLAAGRQHQVLPLSGVTHMTPQAVVAENLLLLQRDFLQDHLAVPKDS